MKYFEIMENIGSIERIFRMLVGGLLLGIAMTHPTSSLYVSFLPLIASYFVLTAIMLWDPVGYVIGVILKFLGQLPAAAQSATLAVSNGAKYQELRA
ncbi:MAG: DUF2892 domain-containing protein [Gammaproteobacteria bacterium]|nr:DUF2892 domain-containing protein [Gammaproteobacteria bacterium]